MIIDTHAHLDMERFDKDRDDVVDRASEAGVEIVINPGVDLKSSRKAVELSKRYKNIYVAVGIQPEEVDQYFNDDEIKTDIRPELESLAENKKVVAIGECGLDYKSVRERYKNSAEANLEKEKQKDIFRRQLGTAVLLDLPLIIHNRESDEDILSEIQKYKETKKLRGVFHCFTGTIPFARMVLGAGFYISFTGIITYPNATELRKVVKEVPLENIMMETDSPFLPPQSHRGTRNEPIYVCEIVKEIAKIKNLAIEEVSRRTSENARRLFKI